ncbi:MAG: M48 family metalloprotease [Acidimicrobiales bacterium]|nr:M48 family metalloprotease [Acidimicrobiales bacterium]
MTINDSSDEALLDAKSLRLQNTIALARSLRSLSILMIILLALFNIKYPLDGALLGKYHSYDSTGFALTYVWGLFALLIIAQLIVFPIIVKVSKNPLNAGRLPVPKFRNYFASSLVYSLGILSLSLISYSKTAEFGSFTAYFIGPALVLLALTLVLLLRNKKRPPTIDPQFQLEANEARRLSALLGIELSKVVKPPRNRNPQSLRFGGVSGVLKAKLYLDLHSQNIDLVDSVILHEYGHFLRKDPLRRALAWILFLNLANFIVAYLVGTGAIAYLSGSIMKASAKGIPIVLLAVYLGFVLMHMVIKKIMRGHELAADDFSAGMMGSGVGLTAFLNEYGEKGIGPYRTENKVYKFFFQTHPSVVERVENLKGKKLGEIALSDLYVFPASVRITQFTKTVKSHATFEVALMLIAVIASFAGVFIINNSASSLNLTSSKKLLSKEGYLDVAINGDNSGLNLQSYRAVGERYGSYSIHINGNDFAVNDVTGLVASVGLQQDNSCMADQTRGSITYYFPTNSKLQKSNVYGNFADPSITPDGTNVLFDQVVMTDPCRMEISSMSVRSGSIKQLTDCSEIKSCVGDIGPVMSPDGRYLAFYRVLRTAANPNYLIGREYLMVEDLTTGKIFNIDLCNLGNSCWTNLTTGWSNDGNNLLYVMHNQLYDWRLATGTITSLFNCNNVQGCSYVQNAVWSPDGLWIALSVSSSESSYGSTVYAIKADGTTVCQVLSEPYFVNVVGWSKTMSKIFSK